jgi:hypothetical protein
MAPYSSRALDKTISMMRSSRGQHLKRFKPTVHASKRQRTTMLRRRPYDGLRDAEGLNSAKHNEPHWFLDGTFILRTASDPL